MKTPYEILEVASDANDVEIKQAYLQQVKNNPPDRDQEQFQLIHNAYESIKDNKSRISHALFDNPSVDFEELIDQALDVEQTVQISPEQFNQLLHAGIDDTTIQNAIPNPQKS
jgi:DnaJ-class molecular chaperone